jgi:RNA polymerase sigma-70 factor (ECF subfamily)
MDAGALFSKHHGELLRYARRFTGDADLAEDVVQETFVRLAEHPPADAAHPRAWLYRVATTVAIDQLRSARRRGMLRLLKPGWIPAPEQPPDPAEATERRETRQRVRAALAQLNEKERTVLLMREEGFAHSEIAEAVGTTTGSVGTMIARALTKLAALLEVEEAERR